MAEWYYTKNGQQVGPVSMEEIKTRAESGELTPDDQVWKEGMGDWKPAGKVKGLFPATNQPPKPPPVQSRSADTARSGHRGYVSGTPSPLVWAYRGALGLLLIALLCPWITAESSASVRYGDMGRDMSQRGLGNFGGNQMQQIGNQSASMSLSVSGISTLWGKAILPILLAGAALSLVGLGTVIPEGKQFFPNQEKIIMAAVGGLSLLLLLIVFFTASSYVNQDAAVNTQYGSISASASVAWGWYIAFLAALAAAVIGYLVPWKADAKPIPSESS